MTIPNFNSAADLRAFLDEQALGMRKKYGQNFLINPAIRQALADALEAEEGESVWEIGSGLGAMTSLLLEKGLRVRTFEIDQGFISLLKEYFSANENFTLIEGDVLKTWPDQPPADYLLGNLPYNIAATLIANLIVKRRFFSRMVVTVQREVAMRMAAAPGSPEYSSFSVLCASAYDVQPLMIIKSASFYPRPNVDSQAVLLELRDDVADNNLPPCFYPLLRGLFSSRRKTIRNNLAAFIASRGKCQVSLQLVLEDILTQSDLDGDDRAETLALEEFVALAKVIDNMGL
ncbi:MAG: 16S rRNA (adenine(1518)-N(6)/adenine(1519)-N(6))-dimethyltransferase RsmA [Treponema sp.]|jgi:16S rRNA (adenine1518-N6/adenine1519-N6)-dimethyltransferase|nr:16S rRNA (adenine(1518)-N(6)/adenine(1519)-N(6))-dimethyltransferase RsmA [Treponema sp.]